MAEGGCADVVRFGGDLRMAPPDTRDALAAHLAGCRDCATYVSQIATIREMLRRRPGRTGARATAPQVVDTPSADVAGLRSELLARAELLDPSNAADLTQQAIEVGLAMQRRDSRPRGIADLTRIMHALSDARMRLDARTLPAVDVTAAARARTDSLESLDVDADEPELFYPDLYPGDDGPSGWVDGPHPWRAGTSIPGPEEVARAAGVYEALDGALDELPEPLGDILVLVDLQGSALPGAARAVGLDERSAAAALARARNHVRGRLDEYLSGGDAPTQRAPPQTP